VARSACRRAGRDDTGPAGTGPEGQAPVLDDLDRHVAEAGGRVYLCKDSRLSRDAFAGMYGSDLDSWRAARTALDPASRFRSDLGRRLGLVDP
jgi:decaprenylphospho-beta-D-ribofuranose 2-oxidase